MQEKRQDVELIKTFEGFMSKPYKCSAGRLTEGYGTRKRFVQNNLKEDYKITKKEAELQLKLHLESKVYPIIDKYVKARLNKNQYSALAILIYNIGEGNFKKSTLLRKLNEGDYKEASFQFTVWIKATVKGKKVVLNGLVERRKHERALFDKKVSFIEYVLNYFKGV